jgi:hypothetical protein
MNYNTESFYDQEITFDYDGTSYVWIGNYTIDEAIDDETEYAPGYNEVEVTIDDTYSLYSFYDGIDVKPTEDILYVIAEEIKMNY